MAQPSLRRALAVGFCSVCFALCAASPAHAVIVPLPQPDWKQLNSTQKQILAPLADQWDALDHARRKKWLGIADRFGAMTPDEQKRLQTRISDWARLSADERKAAREKYKSLQSAPPETKETLKQKWQQYLDLPEEEKNRLKAMTPKPTPTTSSRSSGATKFLPSVEPATAPPAGNVR
jgi:hypothetical protein